MTRSIMTCLAMCQSTCVYLDSVVNTFKGDFALSEKKEGLRSRLLLLFFVWFGFSCLFVVVVVVVFVLPSLCV